MRYNKLVRDNIPDIIKRSGRIPKTRTADKKEYEELLNEKLREEVNEFLDSGSPEELADIQEVLDAIYIHYEIPRDEVFSLKLAKYAEHGGFSKRVILEEA